MARPAPISKCEITQREKGCPPPAVLGAVRLRAATPPQSLAGARSGRGRRDRHWGAAQTRSRTRAVWAVAGHLYANECYVGHGSPTVSILAPSGDDIPCEMGAVGHGARHGSRIAGSCGTSRQRAACQAPVRACGRRWSNVHGCHLLHPTYDWLDSATCHILHTYVLRARPAVEATPSPIAAGHVRSDVARLRRALRAARAATATDNRLSSASDPTG
jgi:hypothetical protein